MLQQSCRLLQGYCSVHGNVFLKDYFGCNKIKQLLYCSIYFISFNCRHLHILQFILLQHLFHSVAPETTALISQKRAFDTVSWESTEN